MKITFHKITNVLTFNIYTKHNFKTFIKLYKTKKKTSNCRLDESKKKI